MFRWIHCPVLKINNHATGGWRTKDILRGPKSLETKKLGSSKGWGDQSAKKTNNWRDKKYLMNRWGTKKLRTYVVGWFCWNLRAFWEDQTDQKSAVGGPKRILRTGHRRSVPFQISFCVEDLSKTSVKKVLNWWMCVSISSGKLGSVSQIRILETVDKDNMRKQNHESWEYFRVSRSNQVIFVIPSNLCDIILIEKEVFDHQL